MRAVVYDRYGSPDVLRIEEVERPVPKHDEVLIRIRATTVNRTDCGWRQGKPFFSRYFTGLRRPRKRILGSELAGEVEAVGGAVTEFRVGDRVFGATGFDAHAEFACERESSPLAHMPARLSFEEAAAVCDGAILAMACLAKADLRQGRSILIYGASGSIGTAAVQLARALDADVTAVCNTKNLELVRSLGADRVIDYTQEDFTQNGETYDVVFDAVGLHSFRRCRHSLRPGGLYVETDLGFMWHVPLPGPVEPVGRRQEGDARDPEVHEGERPPAQGADRGREVPGGHRSHLPAGRRGRGDAVRRDVPEDRERRPHGKQGRLRAEAAARRWATMPRAPLQAEADPGVAGEPLQVGDPAEHDRCAAVVGVELVSALRAGGQRVLERVGARRGHVGGDDRAAGEGDLDANRIR